MGSSFRRPSRFWTSVASPFVAASLLVQVGRAEDKRSIVGVCAAASAPTTNQLISVRGLGGFSLNGDGFLLVDNTCVATHVLPEASERWGSVLLKIDSRSLKGREMSRFKDALLRNPRNPFQIVVTGELNCRRIERKSHQVLGAGFGSWGLIPCELLVQTITEFHELR